MVSDVDGRLQEDWTDLNDTRGLFHSFRDSYEVMKNLFADLSDVEVSLMTGKFYLNCELRNPDT